MPPQITETTVTVVLGKLGDDSVAVSLYALLRAGVLRDPEFASETTGSVLIRFAEPFDPVRIDFRGDEVVVEDAPADEDRAHDLEIWGRLPDVVALTAAPLSAGLPRPTHPRGRAALARLADGRVEFDGPLKLARRLLRLLSVHP